MGDLAMGLLRLNPVPLRTACARAIAALGAAIACSATACALLPADAPTVRAPAAVVSVEVTPLPDAGDRFSGLRLRLCPVDGVWPSARVAPENRAALAHVVSARDDAGQALSLDAEGVVVWAHTGCVNVLLNVSAMADALADKDLALRVDDDVLCSPDLWLFHAAGPRGSDVGLDVTLQPSAFAVALPWGHVVGKAAHVDARGFALTSVAAFGRFTVLPLHVGGADFAVAHLGTGAVPPQFDAWLAAAATDVSALLGHFPLPRVLVLVVPGSGARAVQVGFFSRGHGAAAVYYTGDAATGAVSNADAAAGDDDGQWVIRHELAHALLPPVQSADAWFNEGLATLHQDLLARRAGRIATEEAYWAELLRGLDTGSAIAATSGISLQVASAQMRARGSYQHAYWGGVAVLLRAEMDARARGASLDDLVRALRTLHPIDDVPRSADALLVDARAMGGAAAVAAEAVQRAYAEARAVPFLNLAPLLSALGVEREPAGHAGSGVRLNADGPQAALRRAFARSDVMPH